MKKFSEYQYLEGEQKNKRDEQEVGSKFWNEGKWNNFVKPFLPKDCKEMTLIDVGCNAGLFLKLAKEHGFNGVVGVEPDEEAYDKAIDYRNRNGFNYNIVNKKYGNCIDDLPLSDFVIFVNVHYYFTPEEWREYIDKLKEKAEYVIIVTAEKKPNTNFAASDLTGIRKDFEEWQEVKVIDIPKDETPHSRHLTSICFKNNTLEHVNIDELDNGNNQQRGFLEELDLGIDVLKTNYYKRLKDYRKRTGSKQEVWSDDELIKYMYERVALYEDVKKNGLKEAIIVGKNNRITDGNHRHSIMQYLGYKTIIIKRV